MGFHLHRAQHPQLKSWKEKIGIYRRIFKIKYICLPDYILKKGQYSFSLKKKSEQQVASVKLNSGKCLDKNKQTNKLRFLEIVRSIFLICHPPLFHNCDLAVAFSPQESSCLLALWTEAELLRANTARKPASGSYKVRGPALLDIWISCQVAGRAPHRPMWPPGVLYIGPGGKTRATRTRESATIDPANLLLGIVRNMGRNMKFMYCHLKNLSVISVYLFMFFCLFVFFCYQTSQNVFWLMGGCDSYLYQCPHILSGPFFVFQPSKLFQILAGW